MGPEEAKETGLGQTNLVKGSENLEEVRAFWSTVITDTT